MNSGKSKFIPLEFSNVYIVGRFINLFTKDPGFQGQDPRYSITIMLHKNNEGLAKINDEIEQFKQSGKMRANASKLINNFDKDIFSQEYTIFTNKGVDTTTFRTILLKNRNQQVPLYAPDGQPIPYIPKNEKFFIRGTKVNVQAILGNHMGQPFTILTGVQYVDVGFSNEIEDSTYNVSFKKLENASIPSDMIVGSSVTVVDDEMDKKQAMEIEEAMNQMLAESYQDDAIPF